ncbi:MAG: Cof-type HAD-IIB family hydrolase [Tumebacillaceae bacterium]
MNQQERKLIAIDLDGTLLTRGKTISPRTKQALLQAKEQGHHVVIATGRPPRASVQYYEELALGTPMVNFNGALVHHFKDEAFGHHHFPLDRETAFHVIEACEKFDIRNVMVEIKDDYYLKHPDPEWVRIMGDGRLPVAIGSPREHVPDHPTSVLIRPNEASTEALREHLHQHHADIIEHRMWGVPWNVIEIGKVGVNKWTGLEVIAKNLGVDAKNVIAFGDEDNDLEMIKFAGYGVAMGNANPILKDVAAHVTESNDADGIAIVLEKLL